MSIQTACQWSLLTLLCVGCSGAKHSPTASAEVTRPVAPVQRMSTVQEIDDYRQSLDPVPQFKEVVEFDNTVYDEHGCDGEAWDYTRSLTDPDLPSSTLKIRYEFATACGDGEWGIEQIIFEGRVVYISRSFEPYSRGCDGELYTELWLGPDGEILYQVASSNGEEVPLDQCDVSLPENELLPMEKPEA